MKGAEAEGGGGPPEGPDRVSPRSGPVRSELTPRSDPCDNCRHAEAACEWFTDKSQAVSCLRCQGYKKSCRGGAPPTGVKLPKRRRTAVVTDDDDDDDDDAPKAESSRRKTRAKGKGKEKERVEEEKEEESEEEEEEEGEGPAESERTRLRPKGRWAKLEAELRGLDVRELLVRSVVETAQLRVALAPLLRSVREIVDTKEQIDTWEAYAAGGGGAPQPQAVHAGWGLGGGGGDIGVRFGVRVGGVGVGKGG